MSQKKLKPHLHLQQTAESGKYELSICLDLNGQYQLKDGWPSSKTDQTYKVEVVEQDSSSGCIGTVLTDLPGGHESVTVDICNVSSLPSTNLLGRCTVYYTAAEPAMNQIETT